MVSMARRLTYQELAAADEAGLSSGFRWRTAFLAVASTMVLVAVGLACVWARTEGVRLGFEMRAAGEEQRALVVEQARLKGNNRVRARSRARARKGTKMGETGDRRG